MAREVSPLAMFLSFWWGVISARKLIRIPKGWAEYKQSVFLELLLNIDTRSFLAASQFFGSKGHTGKPVSDLMFLDLSVIPSNPSVTWPFWTNTICASSFYLRSFGSNLQKSIGILKENIEKSEFQKLSAAGAKRGVKSLPVRTLPSN